MTNDAMDPHGAALLAYLEGDRDAAITIHRDDGHADVVHAKHFFRPADFGVADRLALEAARGHVLDVGGGAGVHSLALQDRGLRVTAIDTSSQAVEVMRRRGVRDIACSSLLDYAGGPFDTVLMLGHGAGIAGTMDGLDQLLLRVTSLLAPDGQLLVDSLDVRKTADPAHLAYHDRNRRLGRGAGETRLRLHFRDLVGSEVEWLHVDPDALEALARTRGWASQVLTADEAGNYLAKLARVG